MLVILLDGWLAEWPGQMALALARPMAAADNAITPRKLLALYRARYDGDLELAVVDAVRSRLLTVAASTMRSRGGWRGRGR